MTEVRTTPAKHIFLDIVGFTRKRSVEAQSEIVEILNNIVRDCLKRHSVSARKRILLPTGDGMCIALLNIEKPYDIHVQIALSILEALDRHNNEAIYGDTSRQFDVRIGINANTDNLITDINGRLNIAGAGINVAQRVMDKADGGQILVSQTVYETLRHREKYMNSFEEFTATTKHSEKVNVYQLLDYAADGLNVEVPSAFRFEEKDNRLTRLVAYYLAHALVNREALLERKDPTDMYAGVILLYFKANDSIELSDAVEFREPVLKTYEAE